MEHRSRDRQRAAQRLAAAAHRARNLWTMPFARGGIVRRLAPRAFAVRHPPRRTARAEALLRRRANRGRGLRIRLIPPEQDVLEGGDVYRLPRAAQPPAAGEGRRGLPAMPYGGEIRDGGA